LAAEMEVDQLQTVGQVALLQVFDGFEHLGQSQAELGTVARTAAPAAGPAGGQLDAHADHRPDLQLLGVADNGFQLGELLNNRDDLLADLAGEHGHAQEFVVLEAVADDGRVAAIGQGQDGQQLGLAAGFQAEVVGLAEVENFLDDLALLIDLDGIDAAIAALVLELLDGLFEGIVQFADAVAQNVGEAEQDRQLDAAGLELIDQLLKVDGLVGALVGLNDHVAGLVDGEVTFTPVADAVGFGGILNLPFFQQFRLGAFRHRRSPPWRGGEVVGWF